MTRRELRNAEMICYAVVLFAIAERGDKAEVRVTYKGLESAYECDNDCSNAWGMLINGNLRKESHNCAGNVIGRERN